MVNFGFLAQMFARQNVAQLEKGVKDYLVKSPAWHRFVHGSKDKVNEVGTKAQEVVRKAQAHAQAAANGATRGTPSKSKTVGTKTSSKDGTTADDFNLEAKAREMYSQLPDPVKKMGASAANGFYRKGMNRVMTQVISKLLRR